MVRFPPGLRERIRAHSEAHGRSMNTEIVRALLEAFPDPVPRTLSLTQLLELTEAYENAVGPEASRLPPSDLLRILHRVDVGDVEGIDAAVVAILREKLDSFRG